MKCQNVLVGGELGSQWPGDRWPLVGRAGELAGIAAARQAGLPGVVIDGAAGLGKSRLAREALAAAARDRCVSAWVQGARSAAGVPLGAYGGSLPAGVRSDDPFELMQLGVQALRDRAGGRPLVLAVDDAQWLDPASATLTRHLARTGTAFVVVTVRTGEPCPDAITWLWKGCRRSAGGAGPAHQRGDGRAGRSRRCR
jgi:hypothetical protein